MPQALPYVGYAAATWAGNKLAGMGGDDDGDGGGGMDLNTRLQMDPATEARQLGLWNQAQQFAGTQPFSSQYGGASQLGLSKMSTEGQRYLSNQILGPGQYWEGAKDLGFKGYERPDEAAGDPEWVYNPDLRTGRTGWTTGAAWAPTAAADLRNFDEFGNVIRFDSTPGATPLKNVPPSLTAATTKPQYDKFGNVTTQWQNVQPFSSTAGTTQPGGMQYSAPSGQPWDVMGGGPTGLLGTRAEEETRRAPGPTRVGPNDPGWEAFLAAEEARSPAYQNEAGEWMPGRGTALRAEGEQYPHWMWDLPAEQQVPGRPYSQGVGIREMEEAGDVTRRMLRETEPGTPGYDRFLAGELDPVTGIAGPRGWQEQAQAGIGETPGFERDATGNLVPREGFGFSGAELGGVARTPILDAAGNPTGEFYDAPGYRPSYDAIRGGVTGVGADAVRATPFGVDEQDPFTVGETRVGPNDPAAWEAFLSTKDPDNRAALRQEGIENPDWTWPVASDVPAVDRGLISGQTGYGTEGIGQRAVRDESGKQVFDPITGQPIMESALGISAEERALSQIGQAAGPQGVVDPVTGAVSSAAERIKAADISPIGQFRDPDTGLVTDVMTPGAINLGEALTPGTAAAITQADITAGKFATAAPTTFAGAQFLGGPEGSPAIADYMNQAGVEASVAQARQDYEVALNREKARQAQVGAFGARGTVEEAGLIEAQERNIAQIRGAGYERAAQMMEADVGRRQQVGLQEQQLTFQGGIRGQELEAQRRESDAARAQQAALSSRQLTAQEEMQTQALGFEGGMRAQQLGQQADIRQAELDMEAARANQATALTSGSQTQQIQASRQMRQAELNLQNQQATQRIEAEAGMQQAGFGQQAAIRQTELDLARQQATQGLGAEAFMQQRQLGQQAAIASASNALAAAQSDQQAALASGNQAAALEAARRAQGAQAQIDIASRTQALGAGAAGQQAQLEAARLQRLSEMGLQAGGMGMDAQAQFRQQQMAAAQQLADIGGMRQGATFGAGAQLAGMGAQQEQARQAQMAWDYQQWLRGQEGGAESLALVQSMMPGGQQWQYGRKPSTAGQIGGGLLSAAAIGADIYRTSRGG